jgi:hypothetical protein
MECNNVVCSYNFLKDNQTFLIGARGEELVISVLSQLPDEYHVINDVNLSFHPDFYWGQGAEYIKTSQIDHIVVGPTGIFLLETKKWKPSDIEMKSDKLKRQVRRANAALEHYLKRIYGINESLIIHNVLVSTYGFEKQKYDYYIDFRTPDQLCEYITDREITFSEDAIKNLIDIIISGKSNYIPYRGSNHFRKPRF